MAPFISDPIQSPAFRLSFTVDDAGIVLKGLRACGSD
jgi:hypothetical protein